MDTLKIYDELYEMLPLPFVENIKNKYSDDPVYLAIYIKNILDIAILAVPEQKTITDRTLTNVMKKINKTCARGMFKGGGLVGANLTDVEGGFKGDNSVLATKDYNNIDFSMDSFGGLFMSGGGSTDKLYNIAMYVNKYIKINNKAIGRNAKYAIASFIYMKMKCYASRVKKDKKVLYFPK
jgi:hypothetical protein